MEDAQCDCVYCRGSSVELHFSEEGKRKLAWLQLCPLAAQRRATAAPPRHDNTATVMVVKGAAEKPVGSAGGGDGGGSGGGLCGVCDCMVCAGGGSCPLAALREATSTGRSAGHCRPELTAQCLAPSLPPTATTDAAEQRGDRAHHSSLYQQFERDGFVSGLRILTAAEAAAALDQLEAYETSCGGAPLRGDDRFKIHLLLPWARRWPRYPVPPLSRRPIVSSAPLLCMVHTGAVGCTVRGCRCVVGTMTGCGACAAPGADRSSADCAGVFCGSVVRQ